MLRYGNIWALSCLAHIWFEILLLINGLLIKKCVKPRHGRDNCMLPFHWLQQVPIFSLVAQIWITALLTDPCYSAHTIPWLCGAYTWEFTAVGTIQLITTENSYIFHYIIPHTYTNSDIIHDYWRIGNLRFFTVFPLSFRIGIIL